MKSRISKKRNISVLLAIIFSFFAMANFAQAVNSPTAPQASVKIDKIPQECSNIKKHLRKVRSSDALKRVSLGQNYENLANNFMEKMNLAAISSKLSAVDLVKDSAEFSQNFEIFKKDYQEYERELARILEKDCSKDGSEFYSEIEKLRMLREKVDFSTKKIEESAEKYLASVAKMKAEMK